MSTSNSPEMQHTLKIAHIAAEIKTMPLEGNHFSLQKANVSHTVPDPKNPKHKDKKINLKTLVDIIEINPEKQYAIAESGVTFARLVKETLKYDLVPYCVSELKGITIGGAVSGSSVESMSYKYGGFHDSCLEYEIITATGEILHVSPKEQPEIFDMIHGSFGTLGIISQIKFKLHPAKKYVKLDYLHLNTFQEFQAAIHIHYKTRDLDFMDGIIHSPEHFVLITGKFVDYAPYTHNYTWNIYWRATATRHHDYMDTWDYFFRYDTECHWVTRNYGLDNMLLRTLAGPFVLGSTNILNLAKKIGPIIEKNKEPDVVVDLFLPDSRWKAFFEWYLKEINYWPIWIVPYHIEKMYGWVNPAFLNGISDKLFIDFAVYGLKQPQGRNIYKELEDALYEHQGLKTLISYNYYTEDRFWEIYNKKKYTWVKNKVDPKNLFRNLYEKTHYKK